MEKMVEVKVEQAEICVVWAWDMFNEFFTTHTSIPPRLSILLKEKQIRMNMGQDVEWEHCNEVNDPKAVEEAQGSTNSHDREVGRYSYGLGA